MSGTLSGAPVTLGSVTFTGFEIPDSMPFGGQMQTTVHKLPGGARVIDAMGPDPRDIEFSGKILGPLAAPRARQIDAIRLAGQPVDLTWGDFSFSVVVSEFTPDYTYGGFIIPYKIKCIVIPDVSDTSTPDLASQTVSDAQATTSLPVLPTDAQEAFAQVLLAIPPGAVFDPPGGAAFNLAIAAVSAAAGVVGAGLVFTQSTFELQVVAAAAGGSMIGGSDAMTAAAALTAMSATMQDSAMYSAASAYSSRMLSNMLSGA
jgi:hypothetical protein